MRILLVQLLSYLFSTAGAHKANRILMEKLAESGHACQVVASVLEPGSAGRAQLSDELAARGIKTLASFSDTVMFHHRGVQVHIVTGELQTYSRLLPQVIRQFEPTWILVSEDRTFLLLETALRIASARVVYVSHSQATLPFGPECFYADPAKTELLRQASGIIAASRYLKEYIQRWSGLDSVFIPFPAYGSAPFPHLGSFDRGFITMVNPSTLKGISIFLALAQRLPHLEFAAVPTWATTEADLTALERLPNVRLLEPSENIQDVLARTRVLVVPSLWGEALGQLVIDAMLRGIPVLASNVGGLPEAKLGVDYVLPVHPIVHYRPQFDSRRLPIPVVPEQDITPWLRALEELASDRPHYERLSSASREKALAFVGGLGIEPFQRFLESLEPASVSCVGQGAPAQLEEESRDLVEKRRVRLAQLLHQKIKPKLALLSFVQEQLWLLDQLAPGDPVYNVPAVVRLVTRIDVAALRASLEEIVRRHEILRTTFAVTEGYPVQVIAPTQKIALPLVDMSEFPEPERQVEARRLAAEEAQRPFDLVRGPLVRTILLWQGDKEYRLLLTMHHIISDGWGLSVLMQELATLYQAFSTGKPSPLEPPMQYAEFARWQREWLQGDKLQEQLVYWEQQLSDAPPVLELCTDRPRPPTLGYRGAHLSFELAAPVSRALKTLAQQESASLFMTLLAAFQVLLYRYTGQKDIVVGTLVNNRTRSETERLIGYFANTLVLRTRLEGNPSFRELLARVRQVTLEAYAHQELPFELLVERLQPERNVSYTPLFQVLFFQQVPTPTVELPDLALDLLEVDSGTARFDLTLSMREDSDRLLMAFGYNTDLFDAGTISGWCEHFKTLVDGVIADLERRISDLPLLPQVERQRLLQEWNDTQTEYPRRQCIHRLFEAQVERTPDAVAVVLDELHLAYHELNRRANRLAHHLQRMGVEPETLVGVCVGRSVDVLVGLLAILKAGGGYVPLDPEYPVERLRFMLDDARVCILLAHKELVPQLNEYGTCIVPMDSDQPFFTSASKENLAVAVQPEHIAYVIYTSGSTGRPKGVSVMHRGLCNLVGAQIQTFVVCPDSRVLQFASCSFDASISEIMVTLLAGATLCLGTPDALVPGPTLTRLMRDQAITTVTLPPSVLAVLPDEALSALRTVISAGEACPSDVVARWAVGRRFLNAYGPTEATVCATIAECVDGSRMPPIGYPIANTLVYILDSDLQLAPIGAPGELHIGGVGLARGYLRSELTAERFVPNPFSSAPGERLYKTGDLTRFLLDGNIEFLGRIDRQVKIRGFRIELGEIEAALCQYPAVREAVALGMAREATGTAAELLVAYLVPDKGQELVEAELRRFLQTRLPSYMLPSAFAILETLPLTPSGKVDRHALPAPDRAGRRAETLFEPRDVLELELVRIWEEMLDLYPIGVKHDFFELGGHSLLAARLMARIQQDLKQPAPLAMLFQNPTIERLAAALRRREGTVIPHSSLVPMQTSASDKRPLFFVHAGSGSAFCYAGLVRHLEPDQPFYAFQARGLTDDQPPLTQIEAMARYYIELIQTVQPEGPYWIGGWCMGGLVAFEMAHQLRALGQPVALLALINTRLPRAGQSPYAGEAALWVNFALALGLPRDTEQFADEQLAQALTFFNRLDPDKRLPHVLDEAKRTNIVPRDMALEQFRRFFCVFESNVQALECYQPRTYPGQITLFKAGETLSGLEASGWEALAAGGLTVQTVPGNHYTMIHAPNVQVLAERLSSVIKEKGNCQTIWPEQAPRN